MSIPPKHLLGKWLAVTIAAVMWMAATDLQAQSNRKTVGEVADLFELTNIRTDEPFNLSDAEGSIILLDFFFYW
jgi:cytochrome oxidase Cu insertion factor (SCO1/SenC/PrrC family)